MKIMLIIVRKIIFHLVAIALRAWQTELINRLDKSLDPGKEVKNEESSKVAEKGE